MKRRVHLAWFTVLIALGVAPVYGASPASVTGTVCDSAGVPQIGAVVQLLRPDFSVVSTAYTNSEGRFQFATVHPGRYAVKAMAESFLPSLRENVRVRSAAIVNLTLNTLFEVIQWLPSKPRAGDAQNDDWEWTLRSAANRPLLRWLENGPLVVVSEGNKAKPKLKARIMATGAAGAFGEYGERYSAAVQDTPTGSRELLARVDFSPGSTAGMESMLGFDQDLGMAGSVQSVATVSIHPDISSSDGQGLNAAAVGSTETMNLGPAMQAQVGATEIVARLGGDAQGAVTASLPYAQVNWSAGESTVSYRMATMFPGTQGMSTTATGSAMPEFSARNGRLLMEHGMHQEIALQRQTERSGMAVMVYADDIKNPVLEAAGPAGVSGWAAPVAGGALLDEPSGLIHAAGPNFSSNGVAASFEHRLPGQNHLRLSYANGQALVMPAFAKTANMEQLAESARPQRAQSYTVSFSGTLDGTKTRWSASYRWQSESTLTAVAPYSASAMGPYLNLYVRQPIRLGGAGTTGFEALIDVSNLLAEGYRPYLLRDGSVVIFAQGQRCIRGGLAFTF
ncbi:MAG TPA: carboxypeptidase-like regulatory domain-containing protein [Terracidiphilus sp.]|nr:carboxypeptidase-like regulatory domain-containing protein [Terracidiphilus sp.]